MFVFCYSLLSSLSFSENNTSSLSLKIKQTLEQPAINGSFWIGRHLFIFNVSCCKLRWRRIAGSDLPLCFPRSCSWAVFCSVSGQIVLRRVVAVVNSIVMWGCASFVAMGIMCHNNNVRGLRFTSRKLHCKTGIRVSQFPVGGFHCVVDLFAHLPGCLSRLLFLKKIFIHLCSHEQTAAFHHFVPLQKDSAFLIFFCLFKMSVFSSTFWLQNVF